MVGLRNCALAELTTHAYREFHPDHSLRISISIVTHLRRQLIRRTISTAIPRCSQARADDADHDENHK